MFECYNCEEKAVRWEADYDAEEYGYEKKRNSFCISLPKLWCNL